MLYSFIMTAIEDVWVGLGVSRRFTSRADGWTCRGNVGVRKRCENHSAYSVRPTGKTFREHPSAYIVPPPAPSSHTSYSSPIGLRARRCPPADGRPRRFCISDHVTDTPVCGQNTGHRGQHVAGTGPGLGRPGTVRGRRPGDTRDRRRH